MVGEDGVVESDGGWKRVVIVGIWWKRVIKGGDGGRGW